ncbi:DUF86 domain-containing protein [candidate division WOR-3 bacterium]|nr:DUF86 domain-containing protein [candidate division WOR-3 bacterium]
MLPLKKQSIIPRIDGIENDIERLKKLRALPIETFREEDNFALAQFYLRRALEGIFHIGNHILSRLSGGRSTQYKEIARLLGEKNIVERSFAMNSLTRMAGYRNRLTHFYADVTPEELYEVLQNDLDDFTLFLNAIKELLKNPQKFGLTVE